MSALGDVMSALGDVRCTELGGVNCIEAYYQCTGEHPQCTDDSTWGDIISALGITSSASMISPTNHDILPMHL